MDTQLSFIGICVALIFIIIFSQICKEFLKIPTIYSNIIGGYLFSIFSVPFIGRIQLEQLYPFVASFTAIIFYELGRRVNLRWLSLKKKNFMAIISLLLIMFIVFTYTLIYFDVDVRSARLISAILISSSPAFILFSIKEMQAEGYLTENILHIVGISNILGLFLFSVFLETSTFNFTFIPYAESIGELIKISISFILGLCVATVLNSLSNFFKFDTNTQFLVITLFIISTLFLSIQFQLTTMISLLTFGLFTKINNYRVHLHKNDLGPISSFSYLMIFIFAGYHLSDLVFVPEDFMIALILVTLKLFIPTILLIPSYKINTLSLKKTSLLSLCLMPISSVAILMSLDLTAFNLGVSSKIVSILWSVVVITELVGPAFLLLGLKFSREIKYS